jgi:hypothetical protein
MPFSRSGSEESFIGVVVSGRVEFAIPCFKREVI